MDDNRRGATLLLLLVRLVLEDRRGAALLLLVRLVLEDRRGAALLLLVRLVLEDRRPCSLMRFSPPLRRHPVCRGVLCDTAEVVRISMRGCQK